MIIYNVENTAVVESGAADLYQYRAFIGSQEIITSNRSSYWYLTANEVGCFTGDGSVFKDFELCVEILGYTPEKRTSTYSRGSDLPYLNGCSTKQLVPPNRSGDPTWQMLVMAPGTTEQKHHVHSTARVVYVASGSGESIVGMPSNSTTYVLEKGMVLILPKMEPHHFTSKETGLTVIPLHVFSTGNNEFNHPMFNGTHTI